MKINEAAQDFYHECLIKTARGEVGRKYLEARGINPQVIETFKMGYAPSEWDNLFNRLIRQNFSAQQLEAVGLVVKRKNSSGYYDRFRERIMIPIADVFGHVVGFGGRILGTENEMTPKYLNTPETALFNKRNLLFGLDKSNRAISSAGAAIVVEGYMDAISLFSAGIKNVVATLGTAFTPAHAKLILRYARKIIFCYDSDEAGQRATVRALPIVQAAGAQVFVIKIPDGKDPDDFVRKHGKAAFDELTKNAESLIDYRINYILANSEHSTTEGKLKALQEILPIAIKLKGDDGQNEYGKKIAAALTLDELIVFDAWKRFSRKPELNEVPLVLPPADEKNQIFYTACDDIVRMIWHENDTLHYVFALLPREIFPTVHQEIIDWIETCMQQERRPDKFSAATELSEATNAQLARILLSGSEMPRQMAINAFNDSIKVLRLIILNKKYCELLAEAEKYTSNDDAAYIETVIKSLKIKKEIDNLKSNRGNCF